MASCNLLEGKGDEEMPVSIQDLCELTVAAQNIRPSGNKLDTIQVYHIRALKQLCICKRMLICRLACSIHLALDMTYK
jgi:hypothetical protein